MGKLTKAILSALDDRAMDIFDLADKVGAPDKDVVVACKAMRRSGVVDWMYLDDPVSITEAGRSALAQVKP